MERGLVSLLSLAFIFTLTHCGSKPAKQDAHPAVESSDLSTQEAQSRKARLSQVQYQLTVTLSEKGGEFSGTSEIQFDLADNATPLRLDFFEGKVNSLTVNGQKLGADAKKRYWIELPAQALKKGPNTVEVGFTQEYSHQGQGLHQFIDPETKDTFLYSQFETFDANKFMPCFDQPDLRATFTLTVDAPVKWQVVSTTRETSAQPSGVQRKIWTFPATQPIATYLFSLHAGPYQVWNDKFEDIPLRIFARPAMAKYLKAREMFAWTKQGLKFYNNYFGFRYPFKKYDQLIVPEFNAGAMENVAAITFSERYLSRSTMTRSQRRNFNGTLLHEMAHMWFGDIVTMKWWNNLWLNESFASFMAAMAQDQATEFKESWQDFYSGEKSWAYWEDGLITTHPIEAPVNSVKDAFANFDGITYGKGASALKQLWAYISPEKFQKGIQAYIRANAFKNADLKDYIDTLQAQTDRNLNTWAERWLRQSGADKLSAKWTCQGGKLQAIELASVAKNYAQFRPQSLQVALFTTHDEKLSKPVVVPVALNQPTQTITGNWACPSFVYPNYQDEGYAEISLDPISLSYAKKNLHNIDDTLLRTMVWHDLWQMVRNTEMPLHEYVHVVHTNFPFEKNEIILQEIVKTVSGKRTEHGTVLHYWPQQNEQEKANRLQFVGKMEEQYLRRLNQAKAGSDEQKFWFDSYVALAQTPTALEQLNKWAANNKVNSAFAIDLDRRWQVLRQLARYAHPSCEKLIADMKLKDPSDRGQKSALSTEAIQPKLSVKQKWVDIVKQAKPTLPYADVRMVLGSLFPLEQETMAKRFENDFYEYLRLNGASENEVYVSSVAAAIAPLSCDEKQSARMKEFLKTTGSFTPTVTKALRVDLQEDERCQRIRAFSRI